MTNFPDGFAHYPFYFSAIEQQALIDAVAQGVKQAPFYQPTMPGTGTPLSVVMSNFGPLGWVSDKNKGYRYQSVHPKTGAKWPECPKALSTLWNRLSHYPAPPEACLINWYHKEKTSMGLHVDMDEQETKAPVVSVSLGDPAIFRMGGLKRGGPTADIKLFSGDVVVMAGVSRHCYHGISKVFFGESALIPRGGRINLTLRRVHESPIL